MPLVAKMTNCNKLLRSTELIPELATGIIDMIGKHLKKRSPLRPCSNKSVAVSVFCCFPLREVPASCGRPYGPARAVTSGQENRLPFAVFLSLPQFLSFLQTVKLFQRAFVSERLAGGNLTLTG